MSKPGRTTRSATRQDTVKELGDGMEGIAKVIPPHNSFSFEYDEGEFQTVKTKANKRKENKEKKQEAEQRLLANRDTAHMKGQQPPLRLVHSYVPYEIPKNSYSSKKAKTAETPKNSTVRSTEETRKNQSTQPSMLNVNKDKVHVEINDDLPNKELSDKSPIDQDFQKKGPDGSADLMAKPLPEIVMDDPEITPITINKLVSLKAQCLLPEEEGSAAFCDEGISDWGDDDEAEYEGVKKWKGTSVGGIN
ncbi:unnamed protein product [Rhizophagus irregularis]|uniref:Uncharacterized protein n=1 Tax=Rhizophagus irregularis TaxID=588596 RepID=A0A916EFT5_9GLOM|nr:unnamed protein product [Rhizophagus irregularis]